jgi:Na+/proline symporter
VDFYKRFFHTPDKDDRHYLKAARWGTLVWGGVATFTGLFVGQLGTIVEIMGRIYGFLTGPLVAIFLLGILSKRTNSAGVFIGALIGLGCVTWVAKFTDIHWLWHAPIGLVCSALPGYLLSLLGSPPSQEQLNVQPDPAATLPESGTTAQGNFS